MNSKMSHTRRKVLSGVSLGAAGAVAGCLGIITGDEPVEFSASPAKADESVADETGYERATQEERVVEREFEAAGQSREVVATNWETEYEKTLDLGLLGEQETAMFVVLTTPQVDILGREFNPVSDMSTQEIAEMVQSEYDDMGDIDHVTDRDVSIAGETTTESIYETEAQFAGQSLDIYLHITAATELEDDLVICIGAYPSAAEDEDDAIHRLIESVQPDT